MRTKLLPFVLAPAMASAQSICDSLMIESFTYDPFGNGLHITLRNNSDRFLGYPSFDVLDDQGAIIVPGQSFFFGILPGDDQLHVLDVTGSLPASPFTGSLALTFGDGIGTTTCTFPMDQVSLCPPDSCFPFEVYAISQSGPVNAQLVWTIRDVDNVVMDSGSLVFTAGGPAEGVEATCLAPGEYSLEVLWPFPTGEPFQVGVTPSLFDVAPLFVALPASGSVSMPFTLFEPCIDNAQGLDETSVQAATIAVDGRTVHISTSDGRALGSMAILDAMGRTVHTVRAGGSSVSVDLSHAAVGTYVLRSLDLRNPMPAQRFVVQ